MLLQLDLSYNEISRVPPEISSLWELGTLNLAGNKLATLPGEVAELR